jgi:hypothetical protein
LIDAAKRYRVDTEKLQKAVAKEFAAKRDKKTLKAKARKMAACDGELIELTPAYFQHSICFL